MGFRNHVNTFCRKYCGESDISELKISETELLAKTTSDISCVRLLVHQHDNSAREALESSQKWILDSFLVYE